MQNSETQIDETRWPYRRYINGQIGGWTFGPAVNTIIEPRTPPPGNGFPNPVSELSSNFRWPVS